MLRKILDNKYFQILYKIVKTLIIIVMVTYVAFVVVQRVSGNKSIFGYRIFTVATGSMVPDYEVHDVLAIKEIQEDELKVGDDITYLGNRLDVNGKIVTHRIIEIKEENGKKKFITKGINNSTKDPSIEENQIYGKVVGKIPIITEINHIIKNQYGFFFLIFVPLVAVIFLEIADTITAIKQDKKDVDNNVDKEEII